MTMGEKILNLRKARGWSQEELAEQIGVTRQAVSRWESGSAKPDADKLIVLCDTFGVSADYLLRDAEQGTPALHNAAPRKTLTVREIAGLLVLGLGMVMLFTLGVMSAVMPMNSVSVTGDSVQVYDGFFAFLSGRDLWWLFILDLFCIFFGSWLILEKWVKETPFWKAFLDSIADLVTMLGPNE